MLDDARDLIAPPNRDEWLTVKEYAAVRRVHVQTVYAAIKDPTFPHRVERVGRTIRIDVSRGNIPERKAS